MTASEGIFVGKGEAPQVLALRYANRHGLIAGATGTGKTVSLQVLAEGFSRAGVPVFLADIKGDLAGISQAGGDNPKIAERAALLGLDKPIFEGSPTVAWDVFGEQGHPIRATISEMGPLLLSRLLELNDVQEGVLNLTFKVADDEGLLLLDLKDLRAMLSHVADNAATFGPRYGTVSKASVGAIQRQLLVLEQQGADRFFGEPALDLADLMRVTPDGRGIVNLLAADKLMRSPRLYATFLLWLLSELFEELPEAGDLPKPKLVFFFDEAHLLFDDAPKALIDKVEQVVRLIRSKGVGVYFITQNPMDIPEDVLGQLGNRVQHALRAFTPKDQRAVKAAAETFRANPKFNAATAIQELAVGEALVSLLEAKGIPSVVDRVMMAPPCSRLGPITAAERAALLGASPVKGRYDHPIDRQSAYEHLRERAERPVVEPVAPKRASAKPPRAAAPRQTPAEAMVNSALRSLGTQFGRQIARGILGAILKR
jgi:DNA helicase HerA-like ATPase